MTEFQGALLQSQMTRIEDNQITRALNAKYLTSLLKEVPGITPAAQYRGCTRNAYHLYMFRYDSRAFAGLPRAKFLHALDAEGIPCSAGYGTLNKQEFLSAAMNSKGFRRIYPKALLDGWAERNQCPANDRLCEEAVWFTQPMLLGPRGDMDQIAEAIRKIQKNAGRLAKA
jgi:dTDP-4-amino-4,6-dideoxygalactose transaminase